MSLFAQMTPEQKIQLKKIQNRSTAIKLQQQNSKFIPNSGYVGIASELFKGYMANKSLDAQEEKQKGILKQIAADKKQRLKILGEITGINKRVEPKGQQQQLAVPTPQVPQVAPGMPQVPQMPPQTMGTPQAPGAVPQGQVPQAESQADKMIKLGYATQNEKLVIEGMKLRAKEGQGGKVGKIEQQILGYERQTGIKMTPEQKAKIYQDQWAGAKTRGQTNVTVNNRPMSPLTKSNRSKVQQDLMKTNGQLEQYNFMRSIYKKEYSTYGTQFSNWWKTVKEKAGGTLTPEEQGKLGAYESWKAVSYGAMNDYIKSITGAAMSEMEAKRIRKAIPDPEKDSPTQYKAKMDVIITTLRMNRARYQYALKNGLSLQQAIRKMPMGSSRTPAIYLEKFMQKKSSDYFNSLDKSMPKEERQKKAVQFLHENFPAYYEK